jgi:hypothetical protein
LGAETDEADRPAAAHGGSVVGEGRGLDGQPTVAGVEGTTVAGGVVGGQGDLGEGEVSIAGVGGAVPAGEGEGPAGAGGAAVAEREGGEGHREGAGVGGVDVEQAVDAGFGSGSGLDEGTGGSVAGEGEVVEDVEVADRGVGPSGGVFRAGAGERDRLTVDGGVEADLVGSGEIVGGEDGGPQAGGEEGIVEGAGAAGDRIGIIGRAGDEEDGRGETIFERLNGE